MTSHYSFLIVFLILFTILLNACNITYKVRNQHSEIEHITQLPCGKISMELVGKGNSKFVFRQHYEVDSKMTVFVDSLSFLVNDRKVLTRNNLKKASGGIVELNEETTLEFSFDLEKGVFEGDTIIVSGRGYIDCHNRLISMDTIIYSFINNLRIQGVNDIK